MLKEIIISKAGFMLYTDYWDKYLSKLSGEQVKECMRIVFHFSKTFEEIKSDDLVIEMVTATIIDNLKRDAKKMEKRFIANRENGEKGGRPPKITKEEAKEVKKKPKGFIPPSLQDVKDYCKERNNSVSADKFFDYYSAGNWKDKDGKAVKNWKQKLLSWEGRDGSSNATSSDPVVTKLNSIAGDNYFKSVTLGDTVIITCNDGMKTKAYNLSDLVKSEIKAQFKQSIKID